MLPGQLVASLAAWLIYGFIQSRRVPVLRQRLAQLGRPVRIILGPTLMLLGAALLIGGVALMASFGLMNQGALKMVGWLAVTLLGLGFVHLQVLSALVMVSVATETEPARSHGASDGRITDRKTDEGQTAARP